MNKWNFLVTNGKLVKQLDETNPVVSSRSQSFSNPSLRMVGQTIYIYDDGNYATSIMFSQIRQIAGVAPTSLVDAFNKLIALIPTSGGGTSGSYNIPNIYQLGDLTLPHTFTGGTLHSISLTSTTGNLVVTINGNEVTLTEGATVNYTASSELQNNIIISSTTGTYTITTIRD
jgi:hypothetical protein